MAFLQVPDFTSCYFWQPIGRTFAIGNDMTKTINICVTLAVACGTFTYGQSADAGGGLFCNQQAPVFQTGEQIVFAVDRQQERVDAIINVQYQGPATQFAWVLPLQSAPDQLRYLRCIPSRQA